MAEQSIKEQVLEHLKKREIKEQGLAHWGKNIEILKSWTQDDWDAWASIHPDEYESAVEKRQNLSDFGEKNTPCIFGGGGACAYCKNYYCETCPLYDLSDSDREKGMDCCYAWEKVYDCFIEKPYTLSAAIKAFEDMLKHIQENG